MRFIKSLAPCYGNIHDGENAYLVVSYKLNTVAAMTQVLVVFVFKRMEI